MQKGGERSAGNYVILSPFKRRSLWVFGVWADWKCFAFCFILRKWWCRRIKRKMKVLSTLFLGEIAEVFHLSVPWGLASMALQTWMIFFFFFLWEISRLIKNQGYKNIFFKAMWQGLIFKLSFICMHTHIYMYMNTRTHEKKVENSSRFLNEIWKVESPSLIASLFAVDLYS